jgi:hypothetical protein
VEATCVDECMEIYDIAQTPVRRADSLPPSRRALTPHLPSCLPAYLRVRGQIMGPEKCRIVGKYQPVLSMIEPIISPRTRTAAVLGNASED